MTVYRTPSDPHWPGGARVVVQFVVNYQEDAEGSVLRRYTVVAP